MTFHREPAPAGRQSGPLDVGEGEWLRVTLGSIGDGVITTDLEGKVTFLNPVAESLTGWSLQAAAGQPLTRVFQIVNEETRRSVENPALRALRDGIVVGLANHTLLIAREGSERPIDDSAAPIRDRAGTVAGVVLVFRDVTDRRRAERELRDSEERFRLLVAGVQDYAIFPLDPQGHISGWNLGAERIKGYTANEILGQHFSIFYPPEDLAAGKPQRELITAKSAGRFEDEGWRLRKDGSRIWANVVITAMRDENGLLRGFTKVTRDLTQRKRSEDSLRSSEQRLRRLISSSRDAIISADEAGTITGWNEAAQQLFGYTEREALGRPLTDLMPTRYRAAHTQGLERLRRTGEARALGQTLELEGLRKDGAEFPLELSLSSFTTDKGRSFTGILRDLSARRRHEAERVAAERSRAQAETLADVNRRKDEFLAMLSHELRNPLAAIVNAVHVLKLRPDEDPVRRQAQEAIERQVGNLSSLVDDLLEISRVTTGRIRLKPEDHDLRSLVQRAVEGLRPVAERNRQHLALTLPAAPVWVHADAPRVEQVVVNLLSNATKYTPSGGHIEVTLAEQGGRAVVAVRDDGMGIGPELLPHVFEPFRQADASLAHAQGLGVGLAIVQRLVQLHGGEVEARSAGEGQGTTVTFRLPVVAAPSAVPAGAEPADPVGARLRLLIVDDNQDAADTTAVLLRLQGHQVDVAYSAEAGLAAARRAPPQVALLDLGMPVMDGYELARRMCADPALAAVKLVAVSGYGQLADRERCQAAGFDLHLVKPVDPDRLQRTLAQLVAGPSG